jgi:SAM-dependent methyltransferase
MISVHDMDTAALYEGAYVDATYGKALVDAYARITALPSNRSDNAGRVQRVLRFAREHLAEREGPPTILDVGSGLCVFLDRMKPEGWDCTALDPDQRAVDHAVMRVGVKGVCADFMNAGDLGQFDVVAFNKVLEHVEDPVAMLAKAGNYCKPDGFIYVELPDGEAASEHGPEREEFFIEHHHIFSKKSLELLAQKTNFRSVCMERLQEPSTKYTLCVFLVAAERANS